MNLNNLVRKTPYPNGRFLYLDALRGIAAMIVVLHHFLFIYNNEFGHQFKAPQIFEHGYFGVELFFLISGFVIFYTLSKTTSIKDFLLKRAIRLYPTFWICLIITFCLITIFPLSPSRNTNIKEALVSLTMFNGLFKIKSVDPSYWTLLVEWFFYLVMATSMFFFKTKQNAFYYFLWAWLLLILFYNLVHKIPFAGAVFNLRYGSFFISGICFYHIYISKQQVIKYWMLLLFSFIVGIIALSDLNYVTIALTIVYLVFLLTIHFQFKFLSGKVFIFFGEISYALYLIHQNVGFIIMQKLEHFGIVSFWKVIITLAIVIGLATLITRKLEKPISVKLKKLLL
ncbi:acyltransferase [Mucilaginibacter sp. HMF5004]|uniref:acyltransferase family protein n=1 Tax=Mucilaginibacter rivuli TaxID=2857527 RepID=UPI001C5E12B7|nr:acyltransferase [Mucilaginibacter rivuli]MBW4890089.1 acyltransferase [Mucilaginibacter rivuli]